MTFVFLFPCPLIYPPKTIRLVTRTQRFAARNARPTLQFCEGRAPFARARPHRVRERGAGCGTLSWRPPHTRDTPPGPLGRTPHHLAAAAAATTHLTVADWGARGGAPRPRAISRAVRGPGGSTGAVGVGVALLVDKVTGYKTFSEWSCLRRGCQPLVGAALTSLHTPPCDTAGPAAARCPPGGHPVVTVGAPLPQTYLPSPRG